MPKRTKPYRDAKLDRLKDMREAAAYLNAASEESHEDFLTALRNIAEAHGISVKAVAVKVKTS